MSTTAAPNGLTRTSVSLDGQYRQSVEAEMEERIRVHQQGLVQHRAAGEALRGQHAPLLLVLFAQGDSWFDYPLDGNRPSFTHTDIIAQLRGLGTQTPLILNIG